MEMQKLENSESSIQRLSTTIDALINLIRAQKERFQQSLQEEQGKSAAWQEKFAVLEAQVQTLNDKNSELNQQLADAKAQVEKLEQSSASNNGAVEEIQRRLEEEQKQYLDLQEKYTQSEQKVQEMQQTIDQTGENIDDIVARLEKVLEENGAGHNNN